MNKKAVGGRVEPVVSSDLKGYSRPYLRKLTKKELIIIACSNGIYKGCTIARAKHILTGFKPC